MNRRSLFAMLAGLPIAILDGSARAEPVVYGVARGVAADHDDFDMIFNIHDGPVEPPAHIASFTSSLDDLGRLALELGSDKAHPGTSTPGC